MNYCIKVMDSNYFGEDNSNKQLLFDSQKKIIDALFRYSNYYIFDMYIIMYIIGINYIRK